MQKPLLALFALGCVASAQTASISYPYRFVDSSSGLNPEYAAPVQDSAGNLYGTMSQGGPTTMCKPHGCGLIYKYDAATGTESALYTFTGGADGANPQSGVILDAAGNLYGTTEYGGLNNSGTVFELSATGTFTVLKAFDLTNNNPDGGAPVGGLVMDSSGNLYGATYEGGIKSVGGIGGGIVFKIDTGGNFSILHTFTGGSDGQYPYATPTLDASGNLYGTNFYGGTYDSGVIFEVNLTTGVETVLHEFTPTEADEPRSPLVIDASGNIYGTSVGGGQYGSGSVFKYSPTAGLSVLRSFSGQDGSTPQGRLILSSDGSSLFGTATAGGATCDDVEADGCGLIYQISTASGKLRDLYSFRGSIDGKQPSTGLSARTLPNNGGIEFFGCTLHGASIVGRGDSSGPTLFKLTLTPAAP
jgi:uncharacterized repeat protein (TIGR03803 family)